MFASSHAAALATFFGGWEVLLIFAVLIILFRAKNGFRNGVSELGKALDEQAHDAGRSAGGIFGKPACEALTPENQTAELYDPAVLHASNGKRSVRQVLRRIWHRILAWLRIR